MTLKQAAKRVIHRLGYDLRRFDPASSESARFLTMIAAHRVNLVFDVGANRGNFGRWLREIGYRGRIVSFEPLPDAWAELCDAARNDPSWDVAPRAAIGAADGDIEINVSQNLYSSSVLKIRDECVAFAPDAAYIGQELVPLCRLDTVGSPYIRADSVLLVKADVQGFEREVLHGADEILKWTVGLHLELSLVPLYDGQCAYDEMITELKNLGFGLWDVTPELIDFRAGRLLQVNATFFRN